MFVAVEGMPSSGTVPGDLRNIQWGIQRKVELHYPECENLIEIIGSFMLLSEISRLLTTGGTRWRSWLRHCAISWKVAGSIPDVTGIFHWRNPSGRTMAMGVTPPLTQMSTMNIFWGVKAAGL